MIKFNSSVRMPKRLRLQLSGTPTDLIGMRVSVRLPCYDNKYSNKKQRHFQHLINENITNFMCLLLNHEFIQTSRSNQIVCKKNKSQKHVKHDLDLHNNAFRPFHNHNFVYTHGNTNH
jgi:hypothetical protein